MFTAQTRTIIYCAAAGVVAVGALIGFDRSLLVPESARSCDGRFANSTLFRFERDGSLLTAADILTKAGADSAGIENVEVMRPRDTSIPAAMQIELRTKPRSATGRNPGLAFPWQPRSVQGQTAACLSYKVFFYADLEFQDGGVLPGLEGGDKSGQSQDRFAAHLAWRHDGQPGVNLVVSTDGEKQTQGLESKGQPFARGGWVKIDQEIVLNEPGRDTGILRVWIDGVLAIEKTNVSYRTRSDVALAGAVANIGYGSADTMTWAATDTRIWISPIEISWP